MNYAGDIPSRVSSTFPRRRPSLPHSTGTSCLMIAGKSSSALYQRWVKLWSLFCGWKEQNGMSYKYIHSIAWLHWTVAYSYCTVYAPCTTTCTPLSSTHTTHAYRLGVLIWNDSCCTWVAIYHLKLLIGHGWKTVFIWNLVFSMPVFSILASQTETECGDCRRITNLWL